MSDPDPRIVADYAFAPLSDTDLPDAEALIQRAQADGHEWVAIALHCTLDDWGVVHPRSGVALRAGEVKPIAEIELPEARRARLASGRLRTFEEALLAAHKASVSLVIRVAETSAVGPLAGGLGVMGAERPAELRERYLAVAPNERVGKRMRSDAAIAPSALELRPGGKGVRAVLGRRMPNLARAAASADDLVLDLALVRDARWARRLRATLARRGARLWIGNVPPDEEDAARALGADGVMVRHAW